MTGQAASSKLNGSPRLEIRPDRVRLVQRRHFGWILVAFPLSLVAIVLISKYVKEPAFSRNPSAYLLQTLEKLEWYQWGFFGIVTLFVLISVVSGLLYALWMRELDIDLRRGRLRFRTGLAGRIRTIELPTHALTTLRLSRLTATGDSSYGSDRTYEYWSLDLEIQAGVEPLNLGQWGRHEEAIEEAERWKKWLPSLELTAAR